MRAPLLALLIILTVDFLIDGYIYWQIARRCRGNMLKRLQLWSAVVLNIVMVVVIGLPARKGADGILLAKMWLLFSYLSVYSAQIVAILFDLPSVRPRLWKPPLWKPLSRIGIAAGCAVFLTMWWGALINRFNLQTTEVEVAIPELPSGFEGFRIVQFSDLHTGTFGRDTTYVGHLVDHINALHPDLVVFTGDIVNRHSAEALPFISTLSRLKAPYGCFAILGNHDYGDYFNFPSETERLADVDNLRRIYSQTGITLLEDSTAILRCASDSIMLIGVGNIGDPPFHTYGSLAKACADPSSATVKVLLSHNPRHWTDSIADNPANNIALTLSGHTHAMQIDVLGWSPAKWVYPTWGGLYSNPDSTRQMYVNIGCGTVGTPMRIGADPEITVLTLRKAQ